MSVAYHEPHRQALGFLNAHHPGLARTIRPGLRPEARARRSGRRHRARREVALSKKKSQPLWVWKAWDRASGKLVDWECGGRDKVTCERLIERLKRWRTRLFCAGRLHGLRCAVARRTALYGQG